MKTVIIEDEVFAARRLENMIREIDPATVIEAKLESVEESVAWFRSHEQPDLIFLDIQLEDDLSFAIFEQVAIRSKIIFTTAFDEYAIKAFKHNSIDYLLKPIEKEELRRAIEKYRSWNAEKPQAVDAALLRELLLPKTEYRERFMVAAGDKLRSVCVADVAYFYSAAGITFMVMNSNIRYAVDYSLDNLKEMLNPKEFFRVSRQYLVRLTAIDKALIYPKSRLKLALLPPAETDVLVSIDKVHEFKLWMGGDN